MAYGNLQKNESLAVAVHESVKALAQADWREYPIRQRQVRIAIRNALEQAYGAVPPHAVSDDPRTEMIESETDRILDLVKHQHEY